MSTLEEQMRPPPWLNEHPAIKRLNVRVESPVLPGSIYRTNRRANYEYQWMVKIVDTKSNEADIYDVLHKLSPAKPNHTLPCDVVRSSSDPTILIMPCLSEFDYDSLDLWDLLDIFWQLVEGIQFLHSQNIAHMDVATGNCVYATRQDAAQYPTVTANTLYIIDYGSSLQLELGPGRQPPVPLGPAHGRMEYDPENFDPYSWDIYCMGRSFSRMAKGLYYQQRQPWLLQRYVDWVRGRECGCTTICHCRPTARRAKQVLFVLRVFVGIWYIPKRTLKAVREFFWPTPVVQPIFLV